MKLRGIATVGVALGTAVSLAALPASAAKVKTYIVVEQNGSAVTDVNMNVGDPDVVLVTHLDDNCLSAFEHANDKTYGVARTVDAPSVATVSPSTPYTGQDCNDTQSWTVHAVANGDTTVHFDPVVTENGNGLQQQVGGTSVQVHVGTGGIVNPPGFKRPAAPAIANAHLRPHSADADACKAHYDGANNWRGQVDKAVARWAHENGYNKLKHTFDETYWNNLVMTEVDDLCS